MNAYKLDTLCTKINQNCAKISQIVIIPTIDLIVSEAAGWGWRTEEGKVAPCLVLCNI